MSEQLSVAALGEACDIIAAHSAIGVAAGAEHEAWAAIAALFTTKAAI